MKLTDEEQKICDEYSAYDENNRCHCSECPLAFDSNFPVCKAVVDEEEYQEWLDYTKKSKKGE